ncbi:MAG TPA: LacI family DNA-binding transcriptional regulator [Gaiellales bacterium]|nr:LacI family DNA-binding transcriptional regulator [Gaiellales bacterium]
MPRRPAERKRATLRELSEITGLSQAGVSYALRGQRVSAATEARVRAAADRIGFRTDPIARALRGGRTQLVGVVGGSLADLWHQQFVAGMQQALRRHGLRMVLADAAGEAGEEVALARDLADQRVDGLIILPIDPTAPGWREIAAATPTVSVNERLPAPAGAIRFDSARGIAMALEHLAQLGHERITALGGAPHATPRRAGLRRVRCGYSIDEAHAAAIRILGGRDRPTAVFALSDTVACGVYAACRDRGLEVPAELSVVGFDDIPVAPLLDPPLTVVGWDTPRAAEAAVELLTEAIDGRPAPEMVLAPQLVARRSTTRPR